MLRVRWWTCRHGGPGVLEIVAAVGGRWGDEAPLLCGRQRIAGRVVRGGLVGGLEPGVVAVSAAILEDAGAQRAAVDHSGDQADGDRRPRARGPLHHMPRGMWCSEVG